METIAIVNGVSLNKKIFNFRVQEMLEELEIQEGIKDLTTIELYELKSSILDSMIDEELLYQYGNNKNFIPNEMDVKKIFNDVQEEFNKKNKKFNINLKDEDLLEDIKKDVVVKMVYEKEIEPYIKKVNENNIKDFYEINKENFDIGPAVHSKHIFIKVNDFDDLDEVKRCENIINEIYNKLENGEKFENLAEKYSECKSSKRGGDLGIFTYDDVDEDFANVVFNMKKGIYSKPFITEDGYHIALVEDYFEKYIQPFEQIKDKLTEYFVSIVMENAFNIFVEKLRENAQIQIFEY